MTMEDITDPPRKFLILLYYAHAIQPIWVEANCYADAVEQAAPGNDVIKIEVIAL
jgi:hypothetical protein